MSIDEDLLWYQRGHEHLAPLRFHLAELLDEVEQYNRVAKKLNYPTISRRKIKAARAAQKRANLFFSGK